MAVRYKPEVHEFIQTHLEQFTIRERDGRECQPALWHGVQL